MATAHQKLGYQFDPIYYQVALDHFCKNFVPASSSIVMSDSELTDGLTYIAKLDFGGMRHFSEQSPLFVRIVSFIVNSLQQWDGRHRRRTQLGGIYCFLYLLRRWKNHVHKAFLELDNVGYQLRKEVAL
ncbi:MAG: hypothetical protein SPD54_02355 [Parabacteroides sp.]|nr:hypothetical protein [Parabacteroides sp.]